MRNIRRFIRQNTAVLMAVIIALVTMVVILRIDAKASYEAPRDYAEKDSEPEVAQRKVVPVKYEQFANYVESFLTTHKVEMQGMGELQFNNDESVTRIDISKVKESGRSLFTGTQMGTREWCDGTLCRFETSIRSNGDTVVSCPADLLARLVSNYVNTHPELKKK